MTLNKGRLNVVAALVNELVEHDGVSINETLGAVRIWFDPKEFKDEGTEIVIRLQAPMSAQGIHLLGFFDDLSNMEAALGDAVLKALNENFDSICIH